MITVAPAIDLDVLLVEDSTADARLVVELLREASSGRVRVRHAVRLKDALATLARDSYHALLLDLGLPDSDGLDTFERAHRGAPHVPIVVLTGTSDARLAAGAVRDGAKDFLVKGSATGEELHRAIRYAVERHASEEALRASEIRYRSLVDGSIQGILIHQEGIARLANPAFARLVGVQSPQDLIGTELWSFVDPDDRARLQGYAAERSAGRPTPSHYEFRGRNIQGDLLWLDCLATVITWDGAPAHLITVVDVTARKAAEAEWRTSEQRFREVAQHIKEGMMIAELPSLAPAFVNDAWRDIMGRPDTAEEGGPAPWYQGVHPDDQPALEESTAGVLAGEATVNIVRLEDRGTGDRWVRARTFPIFHDGAVVRVVGLVEDITEVRQTEARLHQAQRMEAVGRLAGGIAHDFNNLLTAILGYADLALTQLGPGHSVAHDIAHVKTAGESAAGLTRQLLAFSRRQILQPEPLDLNDAVRRVAPLLRRLIGEDIDLKTSLCAEGAPVVADAGQVDQAIVNLAVNARDALPDGGSIVVETGRTHLDESYVADHPGAAAGPYAMLAVSDDGAGMSDEVRRRLFEPFFTTKEAGKGTGLGLATVYGFVKQSRGAIWVYSEPGRGSAFKIYLPIDARNRQTLPTTPPPTATVEGRGETVLVAEDQLAVRDIVRDILTRAGYQVLLAATGAEALELARLHPRRIEVLLTDVVMAGMSGRDLARRLVAERPDVRTIYMSGYTDETIVRHGILEPGLAFIQKPFSTHALTAKVRQVIEATEPPQT